MANLVYLPLYRAPLGELIERFRPEWNRFFCVCTFCVHVARTSGRNNCGKAPQMLQMRTLTHKTGEKRTIPFMSSFGHRLPFGWVGEELMIASDRSILIAPTFVLNAARVAVSALHTKSGQTHSDVVRFAVWLWPGRRHFHE